MEEKVLTLCCWGTGETNSSAWEKWLDFCQTFVSNFGLTITHLGVKAEGYSPKALKYIGVKKRVEISLKNNSKINRIAVYSMPKKFDSMGFDYKIHLSRTDGFAVLTFSSLMENKFLSDVKTWEVALKNQLKEVSRLELFTMAKIQNPMMYVMGATDAVNLSSFCMVKKSK